MAFLQRRSQLIPLSQEEPSQRQASLPISPSVVHSNEGKYYVMPTQFHIVSPQDGAGTALSEEDEGS